MPGPSSYRVTGRPFNAVKPPELYSPQGRWSQEDEFTWERTMLWGKLGRWSSDGA